MKKIFGLLAATMLMSAAFVSCDTEEENIEVQVPNTYDEQYYANIRAYKKTDHCVFFGYYAQWAQAEGVEGWKENPASWGERIIGLPDSLDIVNLWMGVPSNDPNSPDYSPIAYQDMKFAQEKLGTRFVAHADASNYRHKFTLDGVEYDMTTQGHGEEILRAFARYWVDRVITHELDGVDWDYEGWAANDLAIVIEECGKYFGPKGQDPTKLLVVDYHTSIPPAAIEPYIDYVFNQLYDQVSQTDFTAANIQSIYDRVSSWLPASKYIPGESSGKDYYVNGGRAFTEANGNTTSAYGGRMHSIEGFARWNPTQGKKGGFGVFYFGRDYYVNSAWPYMNIRRAIQQANPAVH